MTLFELITLRPAYIERDRAKLLDGRDLTDDERKWLMNFDYRSLYASGVHFFLLNGFSGA